MLVGFLEFTAQFGVWVGGIAHKINAGDAQAHAQIHVKTQGDAVRGGGINGLYHVHAAVWVAFFQVALDDFVGGRHLEVFGHHGAALQLDQFPYGVLLGLGGGLADFVPPGGAHQSMIQAGLRNIYRGLARENKTRIIRQMQIVSMVNGESKRERAEESWLTDRECGEHVCAIVERPTEFKGPVVVLKSREGVGVPDS